MAKTSNSVLTKEEKAAMREAVRERKAAAAGADGEAEVLDKIGEMPEGDRRLAKRIHELVREAAPELVCRTWYGMPAYTKDGKIVCYFKAASKFGTRYAQLGFEDKAALDDGEVWPVVYAVKELGAADEKRVSELVKRAVNG